MLLSQYSALEKYLSKFLGTYFWSQLSKWTSALKIYRSTIGDIHLCSINLKPPLEISRSATYIPLSKLKEIILDMSTDHIMTQNNCIVEEL